MNVIEVYKSRFRGAVRPNQKWRWRLRADNGKKLCNGGEGYTERSVCAEMALAILGGAYAEAHVVYL